ncbi:hypothetical protein D8674_006145 [Pyrus ussuriensis x Pyrus communis]|uniref:Uncharacterized protein n=1 Tax=Pyrus ussuriensis x Pyrus communis TaxID=2448454 RepID=A0A5N5FTF7_9ROSA|nr:hypothetical protein D8674_006145 [Pyrus ussuriensis x Pyrus communis]
MSNPTNVSFFLLLLVPYSQAHGGCLFIFDFNQSLSSDLISDGVHHHHLFHTFAPYLTLKNTYGFLPCTTTVIGNLFLIPMFSLEGSGDPCFKS